MTFTFLYGATFELIRLVIFVTLLRTYFFLFNLLFINRHLSSYSVPGPVLGRCWEWEGIQ